MVQARKTIAVVALLALVGLILMTDLRRPGGNYDRAALAVWALLLPISVTIVGLLQNRFWSRWLLLGAGIAVLPWASALTLDSGHGASAVRPAIALIASLLLLASGTGRAMFENYEGRVANVDWRGRRMALVRWTIVCNIASVLGLYIFVAAYDYGIAWHLIVMASLLIGLIVGVVLLALQKTLGLLLLAFSCVCFVPVATDFVISEAAYAGEAILFALVFAPGVLTGWASLLAFSRPLWVTLFGDRHEGR